MGSGEPVGARMAKEPLIFGSYHCIEEDGWELTQVRPVVVVPAIGVAAIEHGAVRGVDACMGWTQRRRVQCFGQRRQRCPRFPGQHGQDEDGQSSRPERPQESLPSCT